MTEACRLPALEPEVWGQGVGRVGPIWGWERSQFQLLSFPRGLGWQSSMCLDLQMLRRKFWLHLHMTSLSTCVHVQTSLFIRTRVIMGLLAQVVKTLPAVQDSRVWSLGREDSPGEGNVNALWYPCLENPKNRGAWWATVHKVAKSRTQRSTHSSIPLYLCTTSSLSIHLSAFPCFLINIQTYIFFSMARWWTVGSWWHRMIHLFSPKI